MTSITQIKDERHLRSLINKGLKKQVHANTRPSIDFIKKTIEEATEAGVMFDLSDLYPQLIVFAAGSTNQSDYCVEVIRNLKLSTLPEPSNEPMPDEGPLLIYDIECFPNLFTFSYIHTTVEELEAAGEQNLGIFVQNLQTSGRVKTLINPTAEEMIPFISQRMIGFNNRRYDNHLVYARSMGENNIQCYIRSKSIIDGARDVMSVGYISSAWNMSYLDLYELATLKQSLKKWEVLLHLPHVECAVEWGEDVPDDKVEEVAEYNRNDVIATVCLFAHLIKVGDFAARQILANISGLPIGSSLRNHFAEIIFQGDKNPQQDFIYTDLSTIFPGYTYEVYETEVKDDVIKHKVKSDFMNTDPSEGGRVYTEPGVYDDVVLLDVESMHPSSIISLNLFGTHYTQRYKAVRDVRMSLKHSLEEGVDCATAVEHIAKKEASHHNADIYESALVMVRLFGDDRKMIKHIVTALKLGLNSTYGWTSASFPNPFKDPRNKDNIVAKRGALFMIALQFELQEMGVQVVHIKTDSIKIPGATKEIVDFIFKFAKKYEYTFAHEDTYRRMCLLNKAVYICYSNTHRKWEATGAQFAHPIVFKKLFSKEDLVLEDYVEVKEVRGAMWMSYSGTTLDRFVGRIGEFVAVTPEIGGDVLRVADDKQGHVNGTKSYKWEEFDRLPAMNVESIIDWTHYNELIIDATAAIEEYIPIDDFVQIDELPFAGPYLKESN